MNIILTFTIVFATLMLAVAVMNKVSNHRLIGELDELKTRLKESEKRRNPCVRKSLRSARRVLALDNENTSLFPSGMPDKLIFESECKKQNVGIYAILSGLMNKHKFIPIR